MTYDWDVAKERLAKASASLDQSITLSPERTAEILQARARVLARAHQQQDPAPHVSVLTFRVGAESYAIDTRHVRGVLRMTDLTPLPDAPDHVVGMTNVRGEILPLFDLRRLLGRGTEALSDLSQIVLIGEKQLELGLIADVADDIIDVLADDILPPSPAVTGADRQIVQGITRQAMSLIDGAALCSDPRLFITRTSSTEESHT